MFAPSQILPLISTTVYDHIRWPKRVGSYNIAMGVWDLKEVFTTAMKLCDVVSRAEIELLLWFVNTYLQSLPESAN